MCLLLVHDWSPTSKAHIFYSTQSCDLSKTSQRSLGKPMAINWGLYLEGMIMIAERSMTVWRPVNNHLAFVWRSVGNSKLWWDCLQPLRLIKDRSPTNPWPPCDRVKPFYDQFHCREVWLATSKTSLQPNSPCDLCKYLEIFHGKF